MCTKRLLTSRCDDVHTTSSEMKKPYLGAMKFQVDGTARAKAQRYNVVSYILGFIKENTGVSVG